MQRQKGTNNVSGIQQPDSQRTLPPPVPRAGGNSSRRPDADSGTGNTPAGNQDEVWPASFGPRGQSISQNGVSSAGYRVEQAQYMSEEGQFRGGLPATDLTAYGESPLPKEDLMIRRCLPQERPHPFPLSGAVIKSSMPSMMRKQMWPTAERSSRAQHRGNVELEESTFETMRDSSGQLSNDLCLRWC